MTRSLFLMLLLSLMLALPGCAQPADAPADEEVTSTATAQATAAATAAATVVATMPATATATPDAYPLRPTSPPSPESYPAVPTTAPLSTAYPADLQIWILRPLGNQCEDLNSYPYATLGEAVTGLEQAGIDVFDSESVDLAVCEGCDCPTSQHFRVQILRNDLERARTLGWYEES